MRVVVVVGGVGVGVVGGSSLSGHIIASCVSLLRDSVAPYRR